MKTGHVLFWDKVGRGGLRVNYTEELDAAAGKSTIAVTSVQMLATQYYGTYFAAGKIVINGTTCLTMDGTNTYTSGYTPSLNSWITISNTGGTSVRVNNNGSGASIYVYIEPYGSYNDFNLFCTSSGSYNIEFSAGRSEEPIYLSTYTTDTKSTISMPSATTLGSTVSIYINAAKSSYTHELYFATTNTSTTVWLELAEGVSGGTYYWNTNTVSSHFSTVTSRTCYIRCRTKSGTATIGEVTSTITISVDEDPEIGTITITPINDNSVIRGWGDIFVQGYTKAKIVTSYSLPTGASIDSVKVSMNGTMVSETGSATIELSTPITVAGAVTFTVTITDSRGKSVTDSASINVYPYSRPYATQASALRYSSTPGVEDKENGTNISAKASIAYSSVNGYNHAQVAARYKAAGGTYPTTYTRLTNGAEYVKINSTAISLEQSYTVQFVISDSLHTINEDPTTIEITIPTKSVVLHAKDGGNGLAIGGYSEDDGFTVWWDTLLKGKLIVPEEMYGESDPVATNAELGQLYFQLID